MLKLMEFLGEEVVAVLTVQNIRGETLDYPNYILSAPALQVKSKQPKPRRNDTIGTLSVCFVSQRVTGLKNARR
jgi:hypothetical protein